MKIIRNTCLLLLSTVILFFACESKSKNNGEYENSDSQFATLIFEDIDNVDNVYVKKINEQLQYDDYKTLDIKKNKKIKLPLSPNKPKDYYFVQFPTTIKVMILAPGEEVKLYYDSTYYSPIDPNRMIIMSTGSKETERMESLLKLTYEQNDSVNEKYAELQEKYKDNLKMLDEKIKSYSLDLQVKTTDKILNMINENINSYANIYAVQMLGAESYEDLAKEIYDNLKEKTLFSGILKQTIEIFSINRIGSEAVLFSLPNQKKKMINLKDLRGKHVMIDFWASWCRPCRDENPNIKKAYKKYKGKGFEIIGVSTDRGSKQWNKAIADDDLNWIQVIDSTGAVAAQKYKVDYIPQSLLLDPQGKILAKNLRGDELHKKLEEIFGES